MSLSSPMFLYFGTGKYRSTMYGTVYTHADARIDSPVASLAASFMSWPVNGTSGLLLQEQSSATLHGDALWNFSETGYRLCFRI